MKQNEVFLGLCALLLLSVQTMEIGKLNGNMNFTVNKEDDSKRQQFPFPLPQYLSNQGCGSSIHIRMEENSYLESPNILQRNRGICSWNVTAPFGSQVKLLFEDFHIPAASSSCSTNYLEIKDLATSKRFCLQGPASGQYISTGSSLHVRYVNGITARTSGGKFRIRLEFSRQACGGIMDGSEGTIVSPNYPLEYPPNSQCSWKIQASQGFAILLNCRYPFWIENSDKCLSDYLAISLAGREDFSDASKFCGKKGPGVLIASRNAVTVLFKTDSNYHYTGFRCDYYPISQGSGIPNFPTLSPTLEPVAPTYPPFIYPPFPVYPPIQQPFPPTQPHVCDSCGTLQNNARIVGGTNADPHEFPWVVAIINSDDSTQFCGGALINDRYVLTAAHCLYGKEPNQLLVDLGDHDLTDPSDTGKMVVSVMNLLIYPWYQPNPILQNENNDIGLVELTLPVTFTAHIRPVCLPPPGVSFVGQPAVVVGWGLTSEGGMPSATLRKAVIQVLPITICQASYGYNVVSVNMICAGYFQGGIDSCKGDSGGPLLWFHGNRWYVIGVVSFGRVCAQYGFPGIYSRVNMFLDWIAANTVNSNCALRSQSNNNNSLVIQQSVK